MKTKSLIPGFPLSVILALIALVGCKSMGVGAQDDDKTVTHATTISSFVVSDEGDAAGDPVITTQFHSPHDIAIDKAGNFYVVDGGNHRIHKVTPAGEISTLAGSEEGFADGIGSAAQFRNPTRIAIDSANNLYVLDRGNHRIRKVTPEGMVSTFAGSEKGFADGQGNAARFNEPGGIVVDAADNLYVVDRGNSRIRKVTTKGEVSTFVGPGFPYGTGKNATVFDEFSGIAIDAAGTLYVTDYRTIRKVSPKGELGYLVRSKGSNKGSVVQIEELGDLAIDAAGNLYVANTQNHRIRKVTPEGEVSILAGFGESYGAGFADGPGKYAHFHSPSGIAIDATGNLYVADTGNKSIRKISPKGMVSTLVVNEKEKDVTYRPRIHSYPVGMTIDRTGNLYAVDAGKGQIRKISLKGEVSIFAERSSRDDIESSDDSRRWFTDPYGITIDTTGNFYVTDLNNGYNDHIRKVSPKGEISTLFNKGEGFISIDEIATQHFNPSGIAMDKAGNIYTVDRRNNRIRKVTPAGEPSVFAGSGKAGFADGAGSAAQFYALRNIAIDAAGNLYVTDSHRIRKVTPKGEVTAIAGSDKNGRGDGIGSAAQFYYPDGISVDAAGNLYVADRGNHRIRKISPKGEVSTFAGNEEKCFADGVGKAACFHSPSGIAIDAAGNLYVADTGNNRIRKVTPEGMVSTLAGSEKGFADGIGSAARFNDPTGIVIDAAGNLYVTDTENNRICKVTPKGEVSTLAGGKQGDTDGAGSEAQFREPTHITIDAAGNLYVTERHRQSIRKVTPEGEVSTLFGSKASFAYRQTNYAHFKHLRGITADATGNLYVAEEFGILKITPKGEISTHVESEVVNWSATSGGYMDCIPLCYPNGITMDAMGNLYVTDNHGIIKLTPEGEFDTLAGDVEGFGDGKGSAAQFNSPVGITIDKAGNLYVADTLNRRIRKVTPEGEVSTLAGSGEEGFVDGKGSAARFGYPYSIVIDEAGNLYVGDTRYRRIRKVTPEGEVSTVVID
ncbi:MAG: hypothetical protein LBE22_11035 [Azoarcus sp.]|jgi:sugar lactone lactonase YvrE|nr:hypothetical protein [Azoarcus sp.]